VTRPEPAAKLDAVQTAPKSGPAVVVASAQPANPQQSKAKGAVRQIPIVGSANPGDPNNDLSPVYPAAPGKDLPIKQAGTPAPAPAAASAATSASSAPPVSRATLQTQAAAPNSCNIAACSAAYRSFRASDCTYQPYTGPRAVCENPPDAAHSNPYRHWSPRQAARDNSDAVDLYDDDDDALNVRPQPGLNAEYDDDEESDVVVRGPPPDVSRYGLRRNWIIERN
jgi:hypothetical protein